MVTVGEAMQRAVQLHQAGDLASAERIYREILSGDPRNANAWHLLGLVAHAHNQHAVAVEHLSRAIQLEGNQAVYHNHLAEVHRALGNWPAAEAASRQALRLKGDFALAHNTLGGVLAAQGKYADALASYRQALALDPNFVQAQFNLGAALHAQGDRDDAISAYRQAIALDPNFVPAHHNLGAALADAGQIDEAIAAYRQALALEPRMPLIENNLGALLQAQARREEAIECYHRALAIQPNYAGALCNLGGALMEQGQHRQAAETLLRALQIDPRLSQAHFNLGVIYQSQGQRDHAAACYQQVLALRPDHFQALTNLGTIYRLQGKLDESADCNRRALEHQPNAPEPLNNLGNVFKSQGRITEARICYDQTLRVRPDYAQARYNRSLLDLAEGNLEAGWPDYEYRAACPEFARRTFDQPRWRGEPLAGRTLLVFAEQGLGDTLQFIRYLPLLARFEGTVIAEVQPALHKLLTRSGFDRQARLIPKGEPLGEFDLQVPLLSLPGILGTTLQSIPGDVPYLSADEQLQVEWRAKLGPESTIKIGIGWQGSPTYIGDNLRSIPLAQFAPLAQPGVELVSLQKGAGTEQLAGIAERFAVRAFENLDEQSGAFMDTAALIKNLDLVVTSDTALAHLAGALGAPAWVALPLEPDWRWLRERDDSPWYPTMRLFRQQNFSEWSPVFQRMAARIAAGLSSGQRLDRSVL